LSLFRQRLYQIIAGYEDTNDADRLRSIQFFRFSPINRWVNFSDLNQLSAAERTGPRLATSSSCRMLYSPTGFRAWLRQHDANVALRASTAQIEAERSKAKEETAVQVKAIEKEKAASKTPDQAVQIANRYIPLPVPLHVDLPVTPAGSLLEQNLMRQYLSLLCFPPKM
jgi:hypothetical protein